MARASLVSVSVSRLAELMLVLRVVVEMEGSCRKELGRSGVGTMALVALEAASCSSCVGQTVEVERHHSPEMADHPLHQPADSRRRSAPWMVCHGMAGLGGTWRLRGVPRSPAAP